MAKEVRVRIAPSPTGYVHVGNTYAAYFNFIFARKHKGQFIVRLDDTDLKRHVVDAEEKIYEAWHWFGLDWDEGPDKGGPYAPYHQSERLERYQQAASELIQKGSAYKKEGAIYFKINPGAPVIFQDLIRGEIKFERENLKDFVIIKSNKYPTYQFATVVDEIDYKISHVIRGEEHLSNTPLQLLALGALGGEIPLYAHLPLLRNPDRSKLSKRQGHASLDWYRQKGIFPETLKNFFALLGWSHPDQKEVFDETEFIKLFSFDKVNTSAPVFNLEKLTWLNGVYIRNLTIDQLKERILGYLEMFSTKEYKVVNKDQDYLLEVVNLIQERLKTLDEFWVLTNYFYEEPQVDIGQIFEFIPEKRMLESFVNILIDLLSEASLDWKKDVLEERLRKLQQDSELKPKNAFMTIRSIVTGQTATPPLFDTLEVLGRERVLGRLKKYQMLS